MANHRRVNTVSMAALRNLINRSQLTIRLQHISSEKNFFKTVTGFPTQINFHSTKNSSNKPEKVFAYKTNLILI